MGWNELLPCLSYLARPCRMRVKRCSASARQNAFGVQLRGWTSIMVLQPEKAMGAEKRFEFGAKGSSFSGEWGDVDRQPCAARICKTAFSVAPSAEAANDMRGGSGD